ncbi:hypothetical protein GUJ93_ZPchr0003g16551 [Zizania palustris]|uniref:C3H1-type domain-containing protein n=1 Tax=Zizania palustris TaxID=103762 RepID=A0A8J5SXB8_ZIZPA|nr:hypothetical protein GUJ93_ZPchr0003g16551 [Zizania palustris]
MGGKNSTFQTLINPEKDVRNAYVHGISSSMVCRPDVPRFGEFIPVLLQYVLSRQIADKPVMWVAHNGRNFDVLFLMHEFQRCKIEMPGDWLFVDTLPIAKQLVDSNGEKLKSVSLENLREHYKIPLAGSAHRAMQDVTSLCYVLQKLTFELKLTIPQLLEKSFRFQAPREGSIKGGGNQGISSRSQTATASASLQFPKRTATRSLGSRPGGEVMEGGLGFLSPVRSSCVSPEGGDEDYGSPTWASMLEALLSSPSSCVSDGRGCGFSSPTKASSPLQDKPPKSPSPCVSDGRGGGFSSPVSSTRASPLEELLISSSSCLSDCRSVGNAGDFSSLTWAPPLEKQLKLPSSCVSDGRGGGYSSPLGASAEREREVYEAESILRSIAQSYDDCFLRLRDATAELADLRRERLRLGSENLQLSLLLEELESEQRNQASAVAPPKPVEKEATQGGAPKSISIRSTGFLSQKQPQGGAKPQRLRVRASQAIEEAAGEVEENSGEVEVEAYRQGAHKTELCNKWERGVCPYGVRCRFAHGLQELRPVIRHPRYKTLPCQMFSAASGCPYGHRCHFRHSPLPTADSC